MHIGKQQNSVLAMLYVGFCHLKPQEKNFLITIPYANCIKFASSTRLLIFTKTLVVYFFSYLLQNISGDCLILYGKIFMSFSNHSRINLVDYFKLFGSVDNVCCFSFECYLGLITYGLLNFMIEIIE